MVSLLLADGQQLCHVNEIICILLVKSLGAGASHNACLHIDSLFFIDVSILLTVFVMLCSVF